MRRVTSFAAAVISVVAIATGPAEAVPSPGVRAEGGQCAGLFVAAVLDGTPLCTHGADPAPPFTDPARITPGSAPGIAAATPSVSSIPCFGDGTDGNRFHAIYAYASDETDDYAGTVPTIRSAIDVIDGIFMTSATKTGDDRHIRFVTDSNCDAVVTKVVLPPGSDDDFELLIDELDAQGFDDPGRKYVVWVDTDASGFCGIATYLTEDVAAATNVNNGTYPSYAAIDEPCWGSTTSSIEAHEVMHNLGAVVPTSPNSTDGGHCIDDYDRMCYDDLALKEGESMTIACPTDTDENVFDCGNDDYFAATPANGSWLASHWNTANSSFVEWIPEPATILATIATPPSPSGTFSATFNGPVKNITSETFSVSTTGTPLTGSLTCRTKTGSAVSCSLGPVTKATFTPSSVLLTGRTYDVSVSPSGAEVLGWLNGEAIAASTANARIASQEDSSDAVTYGWPSYSTSNAYGGSYRASRVKYASASYTFTGSSITWYTNFGPDQGTARVYVDGFFIGSVNMYNRSRYYRIGIPITNLGAGSHTLKIVAYSAGKYVAIDAFKVGGVLSSSPALRYRWGKVAHTSASGDSYSYEDKKNATMTFTFYGTGVDWYTVYASNQGKATVTIDGSPKGTFDNYSSSTRYLAKRRFSGLPAGVHTIRIVVLGTKRSASSGTRVVVDRLMALA